MVYWEKRELDRRSSPLQNPFPLERGIYKVSHARSHLFENKDKRTLNRNGVSIISLHLGISKPTIQFLDSIAIVIFGLGNNLHLLLSSLNEGDYQSMIIGWFSPLLLPRLQWNILTSSSTNWDRRAEDEEREHLCILCDGTKTRIYISFDRSQSIDGYLNDTRIVG